MPECQNEVLIDYDALWCTLPKGHDGPHSETCSGVEITWPNTEVPDG